MKQYPDCSFTWACSYVDDDRLEGFPLVYTDYPLSEAAQIVYPHLSRSNKTFENGDELKIHCLSILKMLDDYPAFTTAFEEYFSELNIKARIEKVKEGFEIYGVRLIGTPASLNEFSDDPLLSGIVIREVRE